MVICYISCIRYIGVFRTHNTQARQMCTVYLWFVLKISKKMLYFSTFAATKIIPWVRWWLN